MYKWDEAADVVIIGSGFAGLAAGIEAKMAGASVVILEKMNGYGGNSIISDGVMAAAGSPWQAELGIEDSPELMAEDMMKAGLGLNHPELVRIVAEQSTEALQWTMDFLGARFEEGVDMFGGHSVRRCLTPHRRTGAEIIIKQVKKLKELGVNIRTRNYLEKVLTDDDGRVSGVLVREKYKYPDKNSGELKYIRADKAVILAAGGFANDVVFRTAQDPRLTSEIGSTNKECTTAETLKEAMRLGAAPVHLSWIQLGPWASADEKGYGAGPDFGSYIAFPYGIMVDPETGKRVVNELADRKIRADAILKTGRPCIGITDATAVEQSGHTIDHCLKKGVVKKFDSLEELASNYVIPLADLEATVDRYNKYVENGADEEMGKPFLPGAKPIVNAPFYAMRHWPKVHHTMGGIRIDALARVMDLDNQPIKGLYAAGEITGGIHGACRLGSCAIPDCIVFGRIAGKNASVEE